MWSNATPLGGRSLAQGRRRTASRLIPPRIPELLSETVDNQMRFENEAGVCDDRRGIRTEWEQDTGLTGPLRSDD
ncbi:hypothetical protein F4826_004691 [Rahnella inusitata]|nr:hypothetical protein [Rahnella inusitata]